MQETRLICQPHLTILPECSAVAGVERPAPGRSFRKRGCTKTCYPALATCGDQLLGRSKT